jgi:5,6-dimethylbenzimidazole synthase
MQFSDFQDLCRKRSSVHNFDNTSIDPKAIDQILAVAHLSPSVGNAQPWRFHVVANLEARNKIIDACCYGNFILGAGTIIVVTCDKAAKPLDGKIIWNPREMEYSCAVAIDHILLAATAMGFGSCCVSLHHGPTHELLGLPQTDQVIAAVMIGMPASPVASPSHERRPLKDMVKVHE